MPQNNGHYSEIPAESSSKTSKLMSTMKKMTSTSSLTTSKCQEPSMPAALPSKLESRMECTVLVVGDSRVGKTALIQSLVSGTFTEEYHPTSFDKAFSTLEVNKHKVDFSIWDTSGSSAYDSVRCLSYQDANVFLLCYKISDPVSLLNVKNKWISELKKHCPNVPIILCGCQSDLRHDQTTCSALAKIGRSVVSQEQGLTVCCEIEAINYVETSAKHPVKYSMLETLELCALAAIRCENGGQNLMSKQNGSGGTNVKRSVSGRNVRKGSLYNGVNNGFRRCQSVSSGVNTGMRRSPSTSSNLGGIMAADDISSVTSHPEVISEQEEKSTINTSFSNEHKLERPKTLCIGNSVKKTRTACYRDPNSIKSPSSISECQVSMNHHHKVSNTPSGGSLVVDFGSGFTGYMNETPLVESSSSLINGNVKPITAHIKPPNCLSRRNANRTSTTNYGRIPVVSIPVASPSLDLINSKVFSPTPSSSSSLAVSASVAAPPIFHCESLKSTSSHASSRTSGSDFSSFSGACSVLLEDDEALVLEASAGNADPQQIIKNLQYVSPKTGVYRPIGDGKRIKHRCSIM